MFVIYVVWACRSGLRDVYYKGPVKIPDGSWSEALVSDIKRAKTFATREEAEQRWRDARHDFATIDILTEIVEVDA